MAQKGKKKQRIGSALASFGKSSRNWLASSFRDALKDEAKNDQDRDVVGSYRYYGL